MLTTADMIKSFWNQFTPPSFPALTENRTTDICVIGAGIAGLTTAYLLSRGGKRVVLLEDGEIASGESGRTTAHLINALNDRYFELASIHQESGATSPPI